MCVHHGTVVVARQPGLTAATSHSQNPVHNANAVYLAAEHAPGVICSFTVLRSTADTRSSGVELHNNTVNFILLRVKQPH